MHKQTGEIKTPEEMEELRKKLGKKAVDEQYVDIPDDQLENVRSMEKLQRKLWAVDQERRTKEALKNGRT